ILESIPGYLTKSQQREMEQLNFWAGNSDRYSVAVLGGIKKEKITDGLVGLAKNYDVIIPGGIVLNTILKVMGMEVGDSILQDSGKSFEGQVAEVLNEYGSKICVPNTVIVYNPGTGKSDSLSVDQGVPEGYRIVDYELPIEGLCALRKVRKDRGRLLVAGTPGLYKEGFTSATDVVLNTMHAMQTGAIVLGGDTAKELDYHRFSTGGGSALYFVSHGTTPVFEALKMNKQRFNV
ncbi:MAG: phosphoglycerate kinase, partial [Nanoarchaeota archaeon]|nr:phosphoglycerate kinase [Nanoarchaeota archaeon]